MIISRLIWAGIVLITQFNYRPPYTPPVNKRVVLTLVFKISQKDCATDILKDRFLNAFELAIWYFSSFCSNLRLRIVFHMTHNNTGSSVNRDAISILMDEIT